MMKTWAEWKKHFISSFDVCLREDYSGISNSFLLSEEKAEEAFLSKVVYFYQE